MITLQKDYRTKWLQATEDNATLAQTVQQQNLRIRELQEELDLYNYNYREAVFDDVLTAIEQDYDLSDYEDRAEAEEALQEALWIDDSVTGNGSGSYTFSTWKASCYLCHNMDLLKEALDEFGVDMPDSMEAADVTIRCYLLHGAINKALNHMEEQGTTPWGYESE